MTTFVYLYHFSQPIGSDLHSAQHYLGSTEDLNARDWVHRAGRGAKILAYCVANGVEFKRVRIWTGDRKLERKLKNRHHHAKLCPICNPKLYHHEPDVDFYSTELDNLRAGKVKPLYVPWYEEEDEPGKFESLHPAR